MSYYKSFAFTGPSPLCPTPTAQVTDLVAGLPHLGVKEDAPIGETHCTVHFNSPDNLFALTDGVTCKAFDMNDPAFTHFTRGTGRSVYYKLPYLSAATGFCAKFLYQKSVGITLPYLFDVYLSEDGETWRRVFKHRCTPYKGEDAVITIEGEFDGAYRASYVKFVFDVGGHVWAESVSLFGKTDLTGAMEIVDNTDEDDRPILNRYPTYDELDGVQNIVLAYNCMPPEKHPEGRPLSVEELLPFVGYYDTQGKLQDTFFDGALFLPFSNYTYSALYKCAEGWKYYLDNTFRENKCVDALNTATEMVCKELGVEQKTKVFLSIFHTKPGYGDFPEKFGDLDGDGVDEDLSTLEGRIKVTKWFIDENLARYNAKERPYLTLTGFYWFEEEISYNDPLELKVLAFARDYVHSLGYKLIWIPYYQAWGYDRWKQNGFDVACVQPNYSFSKGATKQRLYDNAMLAKKFGLCYELEFTGGNNPTDIARYIEYLDCGAKTGFMYSIKMYYEGGGGFRSACHSKDPLFRSVYDKTYLFAKEKYVCEES